MIRQRNDSVAMVEYFRAMRGAMLQDGGAGAAQIEIICESKRECAGS
jgi:hypothetical protein